MNEARAAFLDQPAPVPPTSATASTLLRAHEQADDILGRKAKGLAATDAPSVTEHVGMKFGPFKLL